MKRVIALLAGSLLCATALADSAEIRCFRSYGLKKPLRLQFSFPPEGARNGHVRYENGSANIPVKLIKTESEETLHGRPMEFTTTWKELTPDGGTYTVVSQGANVYGFRFIRAKDRKTFTFEEDQEASEENGCRWKRR